MAKAKKVKRWYVKINKDFAYVKCKKSESCGYVENGEMFIDFYTHQRALTAYYESLNNNQLKVKINVN